MKTLVAALILLPVAAVATELKDMTSETVKAEGYTISISGDCPCPFEWNGRHYLLQGFTGMAYSPDGKPGTFVNWTKTGDSVYGGLSVPMVAPWGDNRRIIVGWINHVGGWGGWLCFRELVQFEDGKLGEKWLPETMPPVLTVREALAADADGKWHQKPHECGSYAIEHVRGLDRAYTVRIIVRYDAKSDVSIFDAEIAGTRTMLSRREGRYTETAISRR